MDSHIKDVMTRDVVSVRETADYKDIIAVMRELQVSAFPVLDPADHLVGMVSEADLLLKELGQEALAGSMIASGRRGERAKAAGVTAAQLMTSPAIAVGPDDTLAAAARLMHDRRVKRLPVVDQVGRLVGIVSQVDLLSVFDRPDDEIRDQVIKEIIVRDFGLDPDAFEIEVTSGILTIAGPVGSRSIAGDLVRALRHAEGVVGVRARLRADRAGR
jgi:CBS-domain-containing membrane protein